MSREVDPQPESKPPSTGAANIGMSSRYLMGDEKNLHAVMIAKDAIAIIVNPKNPIQRSFLGSDQEHFLWKNQKLEGVRRASSVPSSWSPGRKVQEHRESFQKFVMGKEDISLEALVQDSNGAVRQVVASDPSAIGYISLGLVNEAGQGIKDLRCGTQCNQY